MHACICILNKIVHRTAFKVQNRYGLFAVKHLQTWCEFEILTTACTIPAFLFCALNANVDDQNNNSNSNKTNSHNANQIKLSWFVELINFAIIWCEINNKWSNQNKRLVIAYAKLLSNENVSDKLRGAVCWIVWTYLVWPMNLVTHDNSLVALNLNSIVQYLPPIWIVDRAFATCIQQIIYTYTTENGIK